MSKVISGDGITAYQRWSVPEVTQSEQSQLPEAQGQQRYLRADHVEKIQKQAYEEAYAQGLKEGLASGQVQIKTGTQRLAQLTGKLTGLLNGLDQTVEAELSEYVMMISRLVLRRELRADPDYLSGLIKEGLALMPLSCRNIKVALNPEDAALLRTQGPQNEGDTSWQITEDTSLARGDCRLISDSSRIDATLEKRLAALEQTLFNGKGEGET